MAVVPGELRQLSVTGASRRSGLEQTLHSPGDPWTQAKFELSAARLRPGLA